LGVAECVFREVGVTECGDFVTHDFVLISDA
jgi:hypothetical protein